MYGEMSQQRSTSKKIETQGGVEGAVHTDVTEAGQKAASQKGAVEGLQSEAESIGEKIGKSAAKVMEDTAKAEAGVKIASQVADVTAKTDAGILDGQGSLTQAGNKGIAIKAGEDANAMMGKVNIGENTQQVLDSVHKKVYDGALKFNHGDKADAKRQADEAVAPFIGEDGKALEGQAFWNKQAELKSGVFSGSNSMLMGGGRIFSGALGADGNVTGKISGGLSSSQDDTVKKETGSVETFNNDVKKGINTDTQTRELMHANGGDLEDATDASISSDALKFHANPLNDFGETAGFVQQATGMDADTAELIAGAIGLGGISALAANKFTKQHVQLKPEQLSGLNPIKDEEGNVKGYENAKGKRVADGQGFMLDGKGKKLESGLIGRKMRNLKNNLNNKGQALKSAFSPQSLDETIDSGTDKKQPNPTEKTDDIKHTNSSDNIEGEKTSPTEKSITKPEESVKPQDTETTKTPKVPETEVPKSEPIKPEVSELSKRSQATQEIFQQADDVKADKISAEARANKIGNAQAIRDNKLAVAQTPEAVAKANAEYDAKVAEAKAEYPTAQERELDRNKNKLGSTEPKPRSGSWSDSLFGGKEPQSNSWTSMFGKEPEPTQEVQQKAMDGAKAQMDANKFAEPVKPKGFMSKLGDAAEILYEGKGGLKKRLLTAGVIMGLGSASAQAGTLMASSKNATNQNADGILEGTTNTLGTAEVTGGLGTMAAQAMSKFSSVAAFAGKVGSRVLPGVGVAFGTADAANRASKGDELGAYMSAGIAAASTVPVVGSALAIGGTVAQAFTDAYGITGGSKSPAPAYAQNAFTSQTGSNTMQTILNLLWINKMT